MRQLVPFVTSFEIAILGYLENRFVAKREYPVCAGMFISDIRPARPPP